MKTVVLDKDGALINVGPWDEVRQLALCDETEQKASEEQLQKYAALIESGELPEGWAWREVATNPMPAGAQVVERDIAFTADGRAVLAEDYAALRRGEYLRRWPITRQMEAIVEAEFGRPTLKEQMLADMAAVRELYPKASD